MDKRTNILARVNLEHDGSSHHPRHGDSCVVLHLSGILWTLRGLNFGNLVLSPRGPIQPLDAGDDPMGSTRMDRSNLHDPC